VATYKLEKELGRGAMGVVYRAMHQRLNRPVAIKFLNPDVRMDGTVGARFDRERDVLGKLAHPNIVRLLDAGEEDGKAYIAMELVDGDPLQNILDKGPLPPERIFAIADELLDALGYLHDNKLLHRDIKPANVMIEVGGRARLMDFGVVRKMEGTVLTQAGNLVGTPVFFAPEMILGKPCSEQTDLWAMGVVIYQMCVGVRPFTGATLPELAVAIRTHDQAPVATVRPELPPWSSEWVAKFLVKPPEGRWSSAAAAREALRAALHPEEAAAETPTAPAGPVSRPRRTTQRRVAVSAAAPAPSRAIPLAVGMLVAVAMIAAFAMRSRPPAPVEPPSPTASAGAASAAPPRTHNAALAGDALRRLQLRMRTARVDNKHLNEIWEQMQRRARPVRPVRAPEDLPGVIKAEPKVLEPYTQALESMTGVREALADSRTALADTQLDERMPPQLGDLARDVAGRLDQFDAFAVAMGQPAPFSIQRRLEPVLSFAMTWDEKLPESPSARKLFPAKDATPAVLFPRDDADSIRKALGDVADPRVLPEHRDWPSRASMRFFIERTAGKNGRRLHFRMHTLCAMAAVRVLPQTHGEPFTVRLPDSVRNDHGRWLWLSITMRGALAAERGWWVVTNQKVLPTVYKDYFIISEIVEELLD
jgi:predicted Ser/Thr protein kinase